MTMRRVATRRTSLCPRVVLNSSRQGPLPPEKNSLHGHVQSVYVSNLVAGARMNTETTLDDVAAAIREGKLVAFAGAGVTIAATGNACLTWRGLLESALRFLEGSRTVTNDWLNLLRQQIALSHSDLMILAAEAITAKLHALESRIGFKQWLRATFANLTIADPSVLDGLASLRCPIFTTNYDDLLNTAVDQTAIVTGHNIDILQAFLAGEHRIMHLHGHWKDSSTIVLGTKSYDTILENEVVQLVAHSAFLSRSVLFVGFGAGIDDPNLGSLLEWRNRVIGKSSLRAFRLCIESEVDELRARATKTGIEPLPYGARHSDLGPFLKDLEARAFAQVFSNTSANGPQIPLEAWMSLDRSAQWVELTDHCRTKRSDALFCLFGDRRQRLMLFTSRVRTLLCSDPGIEHSIASISPLNSGNLASEWLAGLCAALGGSKRRGTPGELLKHVTRTRPLLVVMGSRPLRKLSTRQTKALREFLKELGVLLATLPVSGTRHPVRLLLPLEFLLADDPLKELVALLASDIKQTPLDYVPMTEVDFPTWKDVESYLRRQGVFDPKVHAQVRQVYKTIVEGEHLTFEDLSEEIELKLGRL
jgi:hypothetical protein